MSGFVGGCGCTTGSACPAHAMPVSSATAVLPQPHHPPSRYDAPVPQPVTCACGGTGTHLADHGRTTNRVACPCLSRRVEEMADRLAGALTADQLDAVIAGLTARIEKLEAGR